MEKRAMKVNILGSESLGVRGLSCVVETSSHKIVIDPGVALGYLRHGLLPHPFQVVVGNEVRRQILRALEDCTDIVISHFHGDHIPLVNANPFQLSARLVTATFQKPLLWSKGMDDVSPSMAKRCRDLSKVLGKKFPCSEGRTSKPLSFSRSMPHGEAKGHLGGVMMTRVEESEEAFVHASDIQLLERSPIEQILAWKPDVVLVSGPPLYLRHLSSRKRKKARENALILAKEVPVFILDHHLLRNEEGYRFLEDLSASAGHKVFCAADYMGRRRLPLEAWRQRLYQDMPVPQGWHKAYAQGKFDMDAYKRWRGIDIRDIMRGKNEDLDQWNRFI
jgi:predicted metallo-beta-lactamase superfamily hydrolase